MTRHGKIARLPAAIREELNRRLANGEPGTLLIRWLNELPEVRNLLNAWFGGRPISKQNLSQWKSRGYLDWLAPRETLLEAFGTSLANLQMTNEAKRDIANRVSAVTAAKYVALLRDWDGNVTDEFRRRIEALNVLSRNITQLRRSDQDEVRMELDRKWLELQQMKEGRKGARDIEGLVNDIVRAIQGQAVPPDGESSQSK